MIKIHLDTDLGGDIDDLCALAMLLRWPDDIHLTGITTVADIQGKRAGYARYVLGLEGRAETPVAAGVDVAQGVFRYELDLHPEDRYWPEMVPPSPNPLEQALDLLKSSIDQGATIVGIGPCSNLHLLDLRYPGSLSQADLYLMGGYVYPPRPGFPEWGNEMDFNFQVDVPSALHVLQNSHPTLIPLSVTMETALRRAYLDDLHRSGALGQLIARQAEAFAQDENFETHYGETCGALPQDFINFQHDALACAIALGRNDGVEIQAIPLILEKQDSWLAERIHPAGKPVRVVTGVDGPRFNEFWFNTIARGERPEEGFTRSIE